ncbi:hypothetical protein JCM8202v2_001494 [Rhodotorula sphaerocarpa]
MSSASADASAALAHPALLIHADEKDGLVIRPVDGDANAARLRWGSTEPEEIATQASSPQRGLQVHCLGGILSGFQVVESGVVATLPEPRSNAHAGVSSAKTVIAIPLSSFERARAALDKQIERLEGKKRRADAAGGRFAILSRKSAPASETDAESETASEPDTDTGPSAQLPGTEPPSKDQELSSVPSTPSVDDCGPDSSLKDVASSATSKPADPESASAKRMKQSQRELDAKLVVECLRVMTGLLFSHMTDITRSLQIKYEQGEWAQTSPRWRAADRRYFFNEHLMAPFIRAGLDPFVHVLVQGFADQVTVPLPLPAYMSLSSGAAIPSTATHVDIDMTLISRRSTERPGLRYQRRGINAAGEVANFVETEFIIGCEREGARHFGAFVQTRGSIPVFWSQSPWALKPPPVLERTAEESRTAMRKHLDGLKERYGRLVLVNLAETSGKEASVVEAYRSGVDALEYREEDIRYVSFDFHRETKGFNYARISNLIDDLKGDLADMGTFWATPDTNFSSQNGTCRVNCIDSLDRTNVVQTAIARWVLNQHLIHLGIASGEGMHDDLDLAFNCLWADNGDAISREYAGTSALKADFTRTGKRDWRGAMNEYVTRASNSITRILQSAVTDFFKQAALDYILGVNLNAFQDFAARLETSDPGEIVRIAAIRQEAIDTATHEVLPDGEAKLAAWNLLSPSEIDTVRPRKGGKYEEKVLLLSTKAIYIVSYDYNLQKVTSYTRIPTGNILQIRRGAYIISSLDAAGRDPDENYGLALRYRAADTTERLRTYSLRTTSMRQRSKLKELSLPAQAAARSVAAAAGTRLGVETGVGEGEESHFVAFKALRRDAVKVSSSDGSMTELPTRSGVTARDTVAEIVARIQEECVKVGGASPDEKDFVVEQDIISLAESRAATSIVDRLSHSLYKAIWL